MVRRWQDLADEYQAALTVTTIDPGIEVITERLADPATGILVSNARSQSQNGWNRLMKHSFEIEIRETEGREPSLYGVVLQEAGRHLNGLNYSHLVH